jgi:hypothetical protein
MKYLIIIPAFFISIRCISSPQMPDYIIYINDTIPVYNLILEKYFEAIQEPDNGTLFGPSFRGDPGIINPNCWRGYQAIYQISNDSIFLVHIISCG